MIINKDEYIKGLEELMVAVAKMVKCLPSYADPSPDGDNRHIIKNLNLLVENNEILRKALFNAKNELESWNLQQGDKETAKIIKECCKALNT